MLPRSVVPPSFASEELAHRIQPALRGRHKAVDKAKSDDQAPSLPLSSGIPIPVWEPQRQAGRQRRSPNDPGSVLRVSSEPLTQGLPRLGLVSQVYLTKRYPLYSPLPRYGCATGVPRYSLEVRSYYANHILPGLDPRTAIRHIEADALENFLNSYEETPALRRNLYFALSPFFKWCLKKGLIKYNPLLAVDPPPPVSARDRVLSDNEITKLISTLPQVDVPFGSLVLLLLFTCQRRNEIARLSKVEVDLSQGLWVLPKQRSKNKKPHVVPLTSSVLSILESLPSPYPCSSDGGLTPISGFSKRMTSLRKKLPPEMRDFRLHDLRRTGATIMARLGVRPDIIERVLNHSQPSLLGTYQQWEYLEEKRQALSVLEKHLCTLIIESTLRG